MLLKTNSIKALLAFEILKNCQNENEELKSQVLKIVEKNLELTGNSLQEKFKDLKYGIELYFYYIHKKRIIYGRPLKCRSITLDNYV